MAPEGRDCGASGFTLMELVVGLALMGLMTSLLVASLGLGGRIWQRSAAANEALEDRLILTRIFADWAARAVPLLREDGLPAYSGDARRFAFAVRSVAARPHPFLEEAAFEIRGEGGTEIWLVLTPLAGEGPAEERHLLSGAGPLGFRYSVGGEWMEKLEAAAPRLVAIGPATGSVEDALAIAILGEMAPHRCLIRPDEFAPVLLDEACLR